MIANLTGELHNLILGPHDLRHARVLLSHSIDKHAHCEARRPSVRTVRVVVHGDAVGAHGRPAHRPEDVLNRLGHHVAAVCVGIHIEQTAGEILGQLGRLQGDLDDFQTEYDTLGGHIRHAANKYDDAGRKLNRLGDKLRLTSETRIERLPDGDDPES